MPKRLTAKMKIVIRTGLQLKLMIVSHLPGLNLLRLPLQKPMLKQLMMTRLLKKMSLLNQSQGRNR